MSKPETPAVDSGLPEDFPPIEEVDALSSDKETVYGGEIVNWPSLGYTYINCWWSNEPNAFFLIFYL